ncbi:Succinate dehydrogenase iron-sulfur subunit [Diplonema papillatum]|nr:Succinate dehydrogenase iron-sulfur subunit [Diplonema papillatum]
MTQPSRRYASALFNYRKIVKDATHKVAAERLYTTKDTESAIVCLSSYRGGWGEWSLNRWYLKAKVHPTNRSRLEGLYQCVLCASCTASCPSYWWNREVFLGPSVLLQSYRWISEPLDTDLDNRLALLENSPKLNMCHNIMNCTIVCPKYLNPAYVIKQTKKELHPTAPAVGRSIEA